MFTVLAQMWLWAEYHRRVFPDSFFAGWSRKIRLLFYTLLPVVWIGSVIRLLEFGAIALIWLPPMIALVLATIIRHRLLIEETKVLTLAAGVLLLVASPILMSKYVVIGVVGYCLLFIAIYWSKSRIKAQIQAPFLLTSIVTFLGIIIPVFVEVKSQQPTSGLFVAACFWLFIYSNPINKSLSRLMVPRSLVINRFIMFLSLTGAFYNEWLVLVTLLQMLVGIFFNKRQLVFSKTLKWHANIQCHSLVLLCYGCFILGMNTATSLLFLGPIMAIHGVFVVLQDRSHPSVTKLGFTLLALGICKIAILDINTTELWQKVVMFIGIGCFLLLASFWYQKMLIKYEVDKRQTPQL